MGRFKGLIPTTFLQRIGVTQMRPAWFVLFLASIATSALWALACMLATYLASISPPFAGVSRFLNGYVVSFLFLWDISVPWYHFAYLLWYRFGSNAEPVATERHVKVWGSPFFTLMIAMYKILWVAMKACVKYVIAPMIPLMLFLAAEDYLQLPASFSNALFVTFLLYPAIVLLAYVLRRLILPHKGTTAKTTNGVTTDTGENTRM